MRVRNHFTKKVMLRHYLHPLVPIIPAAWFFQPAGPSEASRIQAVFSGLEFFWKSYDSRRPSRTYTLHLGISNDTLMSSALQYRRPLSIDVRLDGLRLASVM